MKYTTALLGLAAVAVATNFERNDFHAKRNQVVAVTLASASSSAGAAPTQPPATDNGGLEISASAEAKGSGKITFGSGADSIALPRSKGMTYLMTGLTAVLGVGAFVV
ncbi:hypothetical protein B0H63DRAFT_480766 [Podospora didyma]|uniref:Uncharacterized protein n=1 Tax=Podospora didyma TaxID=330526 RepID=A0AAE0KEU4_9PEZI|nr:hypothetical protein B0H63DRAFT_480766 [Podospora didyma]